MEPTAPVVSERVVTLGADVPGRATFRNLSRYSAYVEKTFSRWFRRRVDWAGLNVTAIREVVPADHELVLALDPSYVLKSGEHTEGLGHFWSGSTGRAERGLEVNALSWVDVTANTAYTTSAEMTPPGSGGASSSDTSTNPNTPVNADAPANPDTVPSKALSRRKKTKTKAIVLPMKPFVITASFSRPRHENCPNH